MDSDRDAAYMTFWRSAEGTFAVKDCYLMTRNCRAQESDADGPMKSGSAVPPSFYVLPRQQGAGFDMKSSTRRKMTRRCDPGRFSFPATATRGSYQNRSTTKRSSDP
jgi:hypothetical protein